VEAPGAVETVDARPERRIAEIDLAADAREALARLDLLVRRDRILEVAEQDVRLPGQLRELGLHLGVARIEEVDHARRPDGDLAHGVGSAEGEGFQEIAWAAHYAVILCSTARAPATARGGGCR